MKQFLLSEELDADGTVHIDGNNYHYLVHVRRLAAGEFFTARLPNGGETQVQIKTITHNVLTGKCIHDIDPKFIPQGHEGAKSAEGEKSASIAPIILFQALPKGDKMDLIARQAAEGGITQIVPFVSEFSVAKKIGAESQKFLRWEKIIKEARQQSGSGISTSLREPVTINELLYLWRELKERGALGLLFHHQGLEQKSLHSYLYNKPEIVVLAVGPEGGFSDREVTLFLENSFKPITIGDTILRTETAALYCSAAIRILLLEKNTWELKQA
ncbi:MAG: 16S rRNA (uracil(1498)-N(3))-methyltransferase [Treponema sp.]|nr:16S rRNA (uracil(1498)-N(3))-methyltransferase [Treponema sp.]